jgi:pimeloyl-ACP methyl ester carboxylesterase
MKEIQFIAAGGHRLEFVPIAGAVEDAPTLIFLHEGLGSVAQWRDFPAKLAAATGLPAVIYSRQGHGRSDALAGPRGVDYMHIEALEVLPALRDELGLDDAILVGHSDGASIALIHAGAGRQPVRALILEAPHVFVEDFAVAAIAETKTLFETTDLSRRLARYHDDPDGVFWGWNRIWLSPEFRAWTIERLLPSVTCPVLAIQGAEDEYGTRRQLDALRRDLAGSYDELIVPDCRHAPHRDQETAVLDAMAKFIARIIQ